MGVSYLPGPEGERPMWEPPKPPKKSHAFLIFVLGSLVIAILACVIGAIVVNSNGNPGPEPSPTRPTQPTTPPTTRPTTPATTDPGGDGAKAKAAAPVTVPEGTWRVGPDVKAGKYSTVGAEDAIITLCYWEVRDGSETGPIKAQGATDQPTAKEYVTLKTGQYFKTSGCKPWTKI